MVRCNFKILTIQWPGAGTTFSLFLFGYTCQQNVLDAYNEQNSSNIRRMKKVVTRQFILVTGIYIFIGLFGYFNYPQNPTTDKNILQMYDPITHKAAQIGVILLTVAIVVPLPLIFKPCKDCIALLVYPKDPDHKWIHYPMCLGLAVLNLMLCCFAVVNNVGMNQMLTYVSGSTSPLMCLVFPFMFFTKIFGKAKTTKGKMRIIGYHILIGFSLLLWVFILQQFTVPALKPS